MNISDTDLQRLRDRYQAKAAARPAPPPPTTKPKKKGRPWHSRAKPEDRTADGIVFGSANEMRFYLEFIKTRMECKQIRWWVYQPHFYICGVRVTPDFIYENILDEVRVVEIKPKWAPEAVIQRFKRDREQMRVAFGIDVELVQY